MHNNINYVRRYVTSKFGDIPFPNAKVQSTEKESMPSAPR